MIHFFGPDDLAAYIAAGDPLARLLGDPRAEGLRTEGWLAGSPARRMIAWAVYEPLLATEGLRILDVGAGYSSLSWELARRHDYTVSELGAHDLPPDGIRTLGDWYDIRRAYDVVVSVDLFPNVDQRLRAFLRLYGRMPLRLVLTTYEDRWYRTWRDDAEEIMTMQAWDWYTTSIALGTGGEPKSGLFPNGRQVCLYTA